MSSTHRLFFALWPDEALRSELDERARSVQAVAEDGKAVPRDNLHITLRFLGSLSDEQAGRAEAAAARVRNRDVELVLDRAGFWPQPRVLWLGCSDTPDPLLGVVADLNTELGGEGFDLRSRPYKPHVTVARGVTVAEAPPVIEPLTWRAERFCLVRSHTDGPISEYEIVGEWSLID
ncbi:RNA 2',3'-cyclic phosphodiesterase [Natronospira bacteriovora]|uniref:RNA 2',3'-cyclic phosphodiesterase n=1 Tax=Natronospira bacteriovora TaxID=3069753 RepID=A0ABU0W8R5_9GAMM|nr:RNA 2',3'-cyclic phosphodiesterase [Natronospira sp. AB-CW4]MDQ2070436.1 RNA 2',3'-cyclic phosphodiesterase [Natronospira sp. AB-CW4]